MSYQKKKVSPKDFFIDYNNKLSNALKKEHFIKPEKITKFLEKKIKSKRKIFTCGNGGSASVAEKKLDVISFVGFGVHKFVKKFSNFYINLNIKKETHHVD